VIYCVVPEELGWELRERLRAFFAGNPNVEVIVERRSLERRAIESRRTSNLPRTIDLDRRRVRAERGRRVEERRGMQVAHDPPDPLPSEVEPERNRVRFFERIEPSTVAREDADTARLIARIQAGESALYTTLYERYFDRVYSYLRIALQDPDEAEDATQDVFIRVLQAIPRYERRSVPFRAWLFRIARNCAVSRLRKRGRYTLAPPTALLQEGLVESDRIGSIEDSELVSLIERLPLGQRQVLTLRYMLDLPNREIATILDRTPESIRQLHHRALQYLRRCLEPAPAAAVGRQFGNVRRESMVRMPRPSPVLRARRYVA